MIKEVQYVLKIINVYIPEIYSTKTINEEMAYVNPK